MKSGLLLSYFSIQHCKDEHPVAIIWSDSQFSSFASALNPGWNCMVNCPYPLQIKCTQTTLFRPVLHQQWSHPFSASHRMNIHYKQPNLILWYSGMRWPRPLESQMEWDYQTWSAWGEKAGSPLRGEEPRGPFSWDFYWERCVQGYTTGM